MTISPRLTGGWYCYDKRSCESRWSRLRGFMTSNMWPDTRQGKLPVTTIRNVVNVTTDEFVISVGCVTQRLLRYFKTSAVFIER